MHNILSLSKYSIKYILDTVSHLSIRNRWDYEMIFCSTACSWLIADSSDKLYIFRDLLHVCWTCCMFVKFRIRQIHDSKIRELFCRYLCFRSSIELDLYELIAQNALHAKSYSRYDVFVRIHREHSFDYR